MVMLLLNAGFGIPEKDWAFYTCLFISAVEILFECFVGLAVLFSYMGAL